MWEEALDGVHMFHWQSEDCYGLDDGGDEDGYTDDDTDSDTDDDTVSTVVLLLLWEVQHTLFGAT